MDPQKPAVGRRVDPVIPVALPAARDGRPKAVHRVASETLLGGQVELEIAHAGHIYRLRQTAAGKLILTK